MMPPNVTSSRLLCLLDLSWWLSRAWYVALGKAIGKADPATATARQHQIAANGTVALVVGWFVRLLSEPAPACVAVALDSMGPTWRHKRTEELPLERQYKAGRPERPNAYHRASNTVVEIVQAHAIPILSAEGYEADDCIATAARLATDARLDVAIVSADKDFGALVGPGIWQWPWNGSERAEPARDPASIEAKYGVPPQMMTDWLAIVGDDSDNVRGAEGLGEQWAARILREQARHFAPMGPSMAALDGCFALELPDPGDDALAAARNEIVRVDRMKVNPFDDRSVERLTAKRAEAEARLEAVKDRRAFARALRKLQAQREQAMLARELVTLDATCPIVWRPEELPIGGFDLERVRELYCELGFHGLAAEVRSEPKRSMAAILGSGLSSAKVA